MHSRDHERIALRRQTHDINATLVALADQLDSVDQDAACAVRKARAALFEAWTMLCKPPEDEDDHHEH